jgi:Putative transposase/Transposase zinc-binding domain
MARPHLEVADIFRGHGAPWREANRGHISLGQLKVMSAIENCRTAARRARGALPARRGHVARCQNRACGHESIAYNSCMNRHCPKCQGAAAREWLDARAADLLPVEYFHIVFTLPAAIAAIVFQNKASVYALLFEAASETLKTIAADPRHLGAEIGAAMVLHTWGQTLTHHPHVHCIVPGGGLSPGGKAWVASRRSFFLPVRVLSRFYRRLFLKNLMAAHRAGRLRFFNGLARLANPAAFAAHLAQPRRAEWVVYAKKPFGGSS